MVGCSVPNCSNGSHKGYRLFRFPTDKSRRAVWLQNCRRDKWQPTPSSRICEEHFEVNQWEQQRADGWRKLKPNAVPTLFNVPNSPKSILMSMAHYKVLPNEEENYETDTASHKDCKEVLSVRKVQEENKRLLKEIKNSIIRFSNSCEMDTKRGIKEEDPFSDDGTSKNEFFFKDIVTKTNSDAAFLDKDCGMAVKTETSFPNFCLPNEREFFAQSVMKVEKPSTELEACNKVEIKVEPWWLESETTSICDDIKDGDFTPGISARLCLEAVSGDTGGKSQLPSAEDTGKDTSICSGISYSDCESQEGCVTKITLENVHSEQSNKCSDGVEIYSSTLQLKEKKPAVSEKSTTHMSCLRNHEFTHGDKMLYKCEACGKTFTCLSDLKMHIWTHEVKEPNKFEICDKSFSALAGLKIHNVLTGDKKCEISEKSFNTSSHLIHENEEPHKCKSCDKDFTHLSDLKKHSFIHKGKKPYICKACGNHFTQLSSLKKHKLIHEGIKPYKCETCEKTFTALSDLKRHNYIHEGVRPHKCKICGKRFIRLSSWKEHSSIHEGKKPHKCEICGKSFTVFRSLKMHNLIHEGKKLNKCETCGKCFTQLSHLKRHNLIHEGKKPYKCEICEKGFYVPFDLKRHNLIHDGEKPYKCKTCNKHFIQMSHLKKHYFIHEGVKPYKCGNCEKTFSALSDLKRHNVIHEGKKPHKCEFCEKSFTQLPSLKRHHLMHEHKKP